MNLFGHVTQWGENGLEGIGCAGCCGKRGRSPKRRKTVKSPDMAKFSALCLLVVLAAAAQDNKPTFEADVVGVNLNGGLKGQLLSLARAATGFANRPLLTAAVKITNPGKDYAFLLFYDYASAVDDAGVNSEVAI